MESGGASTKSGDLRKSCDLCCARKRRCNGDGINPCTLCSSKGVLCLYSKKERRGPKPKPKRPRDLHGPGDPDLHEMQFMVCDPQGASTSIPFGGGRLMHPCVGAMGSSDISNSPSILNAAWRQESPPPSKSARVSDLVQLPPATGTLGPDENEHLNSFVSGFGTCTQIVQEDEIREAMIYILTGGDFAVSEAGDGSFYAPFDDTEGAGPDVPGRTEVSREETGDDMSPPRLQRGTGSTSFSGTSDPGAAGGGAGGAEGNGVVGALRKSKYKAERARLAAGVACLWAGIGVGAMLRGHTAEATKDYAEYAREAIKGCYDAVSEEVLRAFLCLAHMYAFREDFPMFFRYTTMAKDVAASLDRQEEVTAVKANGKGDRETSRKGCSKAVKFLLKCFDALGAFLELEGEEAESPYKDLLHPTKKGLGDSGKDRSSSNASTSGTAEESTPSSGMHDSPEEAVTAGASGSSSMSLGIRPESLAERAPETPGSIFDARSSTLQGRLPGGGGGDRVTPGDAGGDAAMSVDDGGIRGVWNGVEARNGRSPFARERVSELSGAGSVASIGSRAGPTCEEEEKFPGLTSAVRVQECLSLLGDNPVAQQLTNFSKLQDSRSRGASVVDAFIHNDNTGRKLQRSAKYADSMSVASREGLMEETKQSEDDISGDLGQCSTTSSTPQMNQVLFVGDTKILEVSMGVECLCISVMCKAVAGVPWAEVAADAKLVATAADAILVPVLSSSSISRSVCAVKLLADAAFAHVCLGATENALRKVRRFCKILDEFPGIMMFPPWRHCFHWMAGVLESAGLKPLYDGLRDGLNRLGMKTMPTLPEFGSAHDIMCNCSHFRCQATHRALAECARRDPYGTFQVPDHCPRWGAAATAAAAQAATSARRAPEAKPWRQRMKNIISNNRTYTGTSSHHVGAEVGRDDQEASFPASEVKRKGPERVSSGGKTARVSSSPGPAPPVSSSPVLHRGRLGASSPPAPASPTTLTAAAPPAAAPAAAPVPPPPLPPPLPAPAPAPERAPLSAPMPVPMPMPMPMKVAMQTQEPCPAPLPGSIAPAPVVPSRRVVPVHEAAPTRAVGVDLSWRDVNPTHMMDRKAGSDGISGGRRGLSEAGAGSNIQPPSSGARTGAEAGVGVGSDTSGLRRIDALSSDTRSGGNPLQNNDGLWSAPRGVTGLQMHPISLAQLSPFGRLSRQPSDSSITSLDFFSGTTNGASSLQFQPPPPEGLLSSSVGGVSVNPKPPLNGISGASVGHPGGMLQGGESPGNGLLHAQAQGGGEVFNTLIFDSRMRSSVGAGGGIGLGSGEVAPVVAPGNNGGTVANVSAANTAYNGVGGGVPGGGVPVKARLMDTGPSRQRYNFGNPRQDSSSSFWEELYQNGDMSDNEVMGMEGENDLEGFADFLGILSGVK